MSERDSRPLRDAALALSLLTIVPTVARWPERGRPAVAGWFGLVGLLVGGAVWGLGHSLLRLGPAGETAVYAVVLVILAAVLTRFLHHDGLADVADAWWGGDTPERRREIMKDSATGAFGTTALILVIAMGIVSVEAVLRHGALWMLPVAFALSRFAATFAAWFGTPAASGLGSSVSAGPDVASAAAALVALVVCAILAWSFGGATGLGLVVLGIILALVVPHLLSARMGGVTGDVMGASVLIVETLLLLTAGVIA